MSENTPGPWTWSVSDDTCCDQGRIVGGPADASARPEVLDFGRDEELRREGEEA